MRRSRIIMLAVLSAIVGVIVPIAGALYVSWTFAVQAEQERLALFANRAVTRAITSYDEAIGALRILNDSDLRSCSADHIALMRALTLNLRSVEEVGYFENGVLKCTSWGITESHVEQSIPDYRTPDGIEVKVRMQPLISRANPMMALHDKNYNVLVDPARYVDVIVDSGIQLAIISDAGVPISMLNDPDQLLLQSIIAEPRNGMTERDLFAVGLGKGWMAVAFESRDHILDNLRREQRLLMPIGAFIAAFIVALVVWLSRRRLSPLGELQIAVANQEFVVHYQPLIELRTGICIGAEALVRWRRPDGELVRPDIFIPLAEESGLIMPITDQIIGIVVSELRALLIVDRSLHIAINLCAEDIKTGRFLPVIEKSLERSDVRPQQIWLEATERGFMDIESARVTIEKARQTGYPVSIDDFGTGYSSLQYLQGLPLDALKIDKAFIDTIGKNTATSSVTPHIIDMAKTLNLLIVAEGVETEEQADYLLIHGVDFGQGWFHSKPLPAAEFIAFCRDRKERYGSGPAVI